MNSEKQYIELYLRTADILTQHSADSLNAVRSKACEDFKRLGFPSRKVERYKYTDMAQLFAPPYNLNFNPTDLEIDPYEDFHCEIPSVSESTYFINNGVLYDKKLPQTDLPEGVIIESIRKVAEQNPELIERYYAKLARTDEDAVTALNTLLVQDGVLIYVPKNTKVEPLIQIMNLFHSEDNLMINRRILLIMDEGAQAAFLFSDVSLDNQKILSTQVAEVYVAENAQLDFYSIEMTHSENTRVSNIYVEQQAKSRVNHDAITLQSGTTRNTFDLVFKGEGSECFCNGCVIANDAQHVDTNTLIDHRVPHCKSKQLYKYVLDDQAKGAFASRVLIRHGAQKTLSEQTNQNLTMSKKARMFSQPMLEIYADDVKCSHGSTVGQLNDAALFYMQQRGISMEEAKLLLQFAFVNEVLAQISSEPLKEKLYLLLERRLKGELHR